MSFCTLALFSAPLLVGVPHAGHGHDGDHSGHAHAQTGQENWQPAVAPAEPTIIGEGEFTYRWNPNWYMMPVGRDWLGSTHGCIVTDRKDNVYFSAGGLLSYKPNGALRFSNRHEWAGHLHGLSIVTSLIDPAGESAPHVASGQWPLDDPRWTTYEQKLWVVHTGNGEALELNLKGKLLRTVAWPEQSGKYESKDQFKPTSIAVGPDGTLYIADGYGRSWIHRYTNAGEYLDSFGGPGEGPGHLRTPHGLWLDWNSETPTLLVADRENNRIVRFALDGKFLDATDPAKNRFRRPCHIQFQGKLGVVSELSGRITLIDEKLQPLAHLGDNPDPKLHAQYHVLPQDWKEGEFCAPHCARLDSQGHIYVMDWNVAGRMTKLERIQAPNVAEPEQE